MKPKLTERSERKFVAEFDPHTNRYLIKLWQLVWGFNSRK